MNCRRPCVVCYCAHLSPLPTSTRVVFLQHPREARVPIGTARMAHLMLLNSELHQGVSFADHPRVQALVEDPASALLFPGEGAQDPAALDEGSVRTLVVVDGTWAQARSVLKQNPILGRLRRIGLVPTRPGNYRIRREPTPSCLATIEAVSSVLGVLEHAPERFTSMLTAFTFMVDRQIELAAARTGPPRNRRARTVRAIQAHARIRAELARAVVVHAEVNNYPRGSQTPGTPELLHLVAQRLATGEIFHSIIAPRRPLAPNAAFHIGLEPTQVLAGEPIGDALARWERFARPGDVLCSWGRFTRDVLLGEESVASDWIDLRLLVAQRLQESPGAPDRVARTLGAVRTESVAPGRAGRMVADLAQIVAALRRDEPGLAAMKQSSSAAEGPFSRA